jgi:hypothetical protein
LAGLGKINPEHGTRSSAVLLTTTRSKKLLKPFPSTVCADIGRHGVERVERARERRESKRESQRE